MNTLANTFFKGLLFTVPIAVTFGLIFWLLATAENLLKTPIQWFLPHGWYVTGMGVVCTVALIFCVGLLVQAYVTKYIFRFLEQTLERIPLVKTLYSSAKDLMHFFAGDKNQNLNRVVKVTLPGGLCVMGFVTNENIQLGSDDKLLAVYCPMSYQIGGYTIYLKEDQCEPLDIPVQKAMQQVLTAHIKKSN